MKLKEGHHTRPPGGPKVSGIPKDIQKLRFPVNGEGGGMFTQLVFNRGELGTQKSKTIRVLADNTTTLCRNKYMGHKQRP